jgi:hypothetical protein
MGESRTVAHPTRALVNQATNPLRMPDCPIEPTCHAFASRTPDIGLIGAGIFAMVDAAIRGS